MNRNEWISVRDKLPETGQMVDVYNKLDGRVPDVTYLGDSEWMSSYMAWRGIVKYWMEIPLPPED